MVVSVPDACRENPGPPSIASSMVMDRMFCILGAEPTRSQLIDIVKIMGWGNLTRAEKRVKQALVDKLNTMSTQILQSLATEKGVRDLAAAYIRAVRAPPGTGTEAPPPPSRLGPPDMSIDFFLNK
jgi:hypothetical protein